jgi:hypothetical protein
VQYAFVNPFIAFFKVTSDMEVKHSFGLGCLAAVALKRGYFLSCGRYAGPFQNAIF